LPKLYTSIKIHSLHIQIKLCQFNSPKTKNSLCAQHGEFFLTGVSAHLFDICINSSVRWQTFYWHWV